MSIRTKAITEQNAEDLAKDKDSYNIKYLYLSNRGLYTSFIEYIGGEE